jgi:uncharacterized protein (TIGR00251 family)
MDRGIQLRVKPNAKKNGIGFMDDGRLSVSVTAPAVDGKANAAVVKFLAKSLGVRKSACRIIRGETSRDKVVEIEGVPPEQALARVRNLK